jgi:hypothetical protein
MLSKPSAIEELIALTRLDPTTIAAVVGHKRQGETFGTYSRGPSMGAVRRLCGGREVALGGVQPTTTTAGPRLIRRAVGNIIICRCSDIRPHKIRLMCAMIYFSFDDTTQIRNGNRRVRAAVPREHGERIPILPGGLCDVG